MRKISQPLVGLVSSHLINSNTPFSIRYLGSFGVGTGLVLVGKHMPGILLLMHYIHQVQVSFESDGWYNDKCFIRSPKRYACVNGALFMFICLYIHIFKASFMPCGSGKH